MITRKVKEPISLKIWGDKFMPIRFSCPNCQSTLGIPDEAGGLEITCPYCSKKIIAPTTVKEQDSSPFALLQAASRSKPTTVKEQNSSPTSSHIKKSENLPTMALIICWLYGICATLVFILTSFRLLYDCPGDFTLPAIFIMLFSLFLSWTMFEIRRKKMLGLKYFLYFTIILYIIPLFSHSDLLQRGTAGLLVFFSIYPGHFLLITIFFASPLHYLWNLSKTVEFT